MFRQYRNTVYCCKYINKDALPKTINEHVLTQKYLLEFKYSKVK